MDARHPIIRTFKNLLTYGVLRPSEITDCKILDTDENNEKINYINIKTKKIVINNHKNNKKGSKIIDIADKQLLRIREQLIFGVLGDFAKVCEVLPSFAKFCLLAPERAPEPAPPPRRRP